MSWPRRGCRGLHLQRGALWHGDSRSYGGLGIPEPYWILPLSVFEAPAKFVGKHRTWRWREDGGISTRKIHRLTVVTEARWSFCKARGGEVVTIPGLVIGRRDPPVPLLLGILRPLRLTKGYASRDVEVDDDKGPREQPVPFAREDLVDLRRRRTSRANARCKGTDHNGSYG